MGGEIGDADVWLLEQSLVPENHSPVDACFVWKKTLFPPSGRAFVLLFEANVDTASMLSSSLAGIGVSGICMLRS